MGTNWVGDGKGNEWGGTFLSCYCASLYIRSCPTVRRSVGPSLRRSVPCYFRRTKIVVLEGLMSSNDIMNDETMSDDEVVASDVPPRYLFPPFLG